MQAGPCNNDCHALSGSALLATYEPHMQSETAVKSRAAMQDLSATRATRMPAPPLPSTHRALLPQRAGMWHVPNRQVHGSLASAPGGLQAVSHATGAAAAAMAATALASP